MIFWQDFSWEAFASLTTGLLAVTGAVFVGFRQTRIQAAQQKTAETTVRIALFERRSDCISKMQKIHNIWMQNARLTTEEWREFHVLFQDSELIFSKQLALEINESLDGLFWTEHWRKRSLEDYDRGKEEGGNEKLEKSFSYDDKVFKLLPNLLSKMKDETRVSDWF